MLSHRILAQRVLYKEGRMQGEMHKAEISFFAAVNKFKQYLSNT